MNVRADAEPQGQLKIGDFGVAAVLNGIQDLLPPDPRGRAGTMRYMSPEVSIAFLDCQDSVYGVAAN